MGRLASLALERAASLWVVAPATRRVAPVATLGVAVVTPRGWPLQRAVLQAAALALAMALPPRLVLAVWPRCLAAAVAMPACHWLAVVP